MASPDVAMDKRMRLCPVIPAQAGIQAFGDVTTDKRTRGRSFAIRPLFRKPRVFELGTAPGSVAPIR